MNNRRNLIIALGAGALLAPFSAFVQPQGKVWRLGYLDSGSRRSTVESGRYGALIDGLRERGYVEGKNVVIEARFADGVPDRLTGLAGELVRQNPDLIMTIGNIAGHAVRRATPAIPIIFVGTSDPVREGFAASLARPGGNMTGLTTGNDQIAQKLVELLILAVPKLSRIAVITNPANTGHTPRLMQVQAAAKQVGKQVLPISARTAEEIERGFATMARERIGAVIILADVFFSTQHAQMAALALRHHLPSIYPRAEYAEAGGLMSYGTDLNDNYRRAGIFVDKILKGAKPGDIPFEEPTRYYLEINRTTANALGIKLNNEMLTRADKVIK